jgi:hypothetical protein
MKQSHSFNLLNISVLLLSSPVSIGRVCIDPEALYIHDQSGLASLFISNNSNEYKEIAISLEFSYQGSDKYGNLMTITDDPVAESLYSITDCLEVFPKHFTLKPGEQQTVRIQSGSTSNKSDGFYWSRVAISSNYTSKGSGSNDEGDGEGMKINYILREYIPLLFIKGNPVMGLSPGNLETSVEDGKLVAAVRLKPEGNSPFIGLVTAILSDVSGREIIRQKQSITVFSEVLRKIKIDLPYNRLNPGTYKLDLTYESFTDEKASKVRTNENPIKQSTEIVVKKIITFDA